MQKGVGLNLGTAATHVVDVVALQGDHIVRPGQVNAPVVVPITGGRVVGLSVEERVGYRHAVRGAISKNQMLTTDTRSLVPPRT